MYFLNNLFTVPEDVGVEKVWYSDTDPAAEIVDGYLDKESPLGVDKMCIRDRSHAASFLLTSDGDTHGPAPQGWRCLLYTCSHLHARKQEPGL